MFSTEPRCIYRRNQLADVVCQFRFPEILTIRTELPANFQDMIRDEYPVFSSRKETPAPKLVGTPGNLQLQKQDEVTNYQFASEDGVWRINLTSNFVSLACSRYTCWEDFAAHLDKPLAAFLQVYRPAYYERVGLRYINFFSRNALELGSTPFRELIADKYLGVFSDDEVSEVGAIRCGVDAEIGIRGGCRVKLHAGIGMVNQRGKMDKEVKFIFDQDLYLPGKVDIKLSAGALQTLHSQADAIFRDAITDTLHEAMEPRNP